jgi:hypothetical protein
MLPLAVTDALRSGEVNFLEHGVLTFLVGAFDFRTGQYVATLRALADAMQWPRSEDYLSKLLRQLRQAGWIECETAAGQRKPYKLRAGRRLDLGQGLRRNLRSTSDTSSDYAFPSQSEVTSDNPRSDDTANPHSKRDSVAARPRTLPTSQEKTTRRKQESDDLGESSDGGRSCAKPNPNIRRIEDDCHRCGQRRVLAAYGQEWLCDPCANDRPKVCVRSGHVEESNDEVPF